MSSKHLIWSAKVPIGYAGNVPVLPSDDWLRYNEQTRDRMGGNVALTNIELEQSSDAALAAANAAQVSADGAQSTADSAVADAAAAQSSADDAQTDASGALSQLATLEAIQYLTLAASGALTNERVLTAGDGIAFDDAGAGGALMVAIGENVSLKDSLAATIVEVADGAFGVFGATPVAQSTGWGAPTGTATKTTFNTATVTLPQLAERVKAMIDYALSRGDFGA